MPPCPSDGSVEPRKLEALSILRNQAANTPLGEKNVVLKTVGLEMAVVIAGYQVFLKHVYCEDTEGMHRDLVLPPPLSSSTMLFMLFSPAKQA